MAVLVMMETLSPLERAVFVLHEGAVRNPEKLGRVPAGPAERVR
ncbi:hypothetical protein GCM10010256_49750 [Streptomyces coeruleorubidus]|nr:hypothetical protein GCM10010256_49750 [Streptomyces coeruleorubidus]